MVFKKHLTPLSKHGRVVKHVGKGSSQRPMNPMAPPQSSFPADPQPTSDQSQTPAPPMGGPMLGSSPPPSMGPPPAAGAGPPLPDDTSGQ
jgi:hypothetical protein